MAGTAEDKVTTRQEVPLCVDLDGTLLRTDTLYETLVQFVKRYPLQVFLIPIWLCLGKARFKAEIAKRIDFDPVNLPQNDKLLEFLRRQKQRGVWTVLATAANARIAERIASRLNLFDEVIASDERSNMSGARKAQALVDRFGEDGFDYVGNAQADLEVWRRARHALVAGTKGRLDLSEVERAAPLVGDFRTEAPTAKCVLKALRVHQWAKNLLVFLPLLAAHKYDDAVLLIQSLGAFAAFCLLASATYILNDLLDLSSDRQSPDKRHRPFAAGDQSVLVGLLLIPVLGLGAIALGSLQSTAFLGCLLLYGVLTTMYSFLLKGMVLLDIIVLALLYSVRVIAGGAVTGIELSFWLLCFCFFLFASLAMVKRYSELLKLQDGRMEMLVGPGYRIADIETIGSLGGASGFTAVLVLALYVNSAAVTEVYSQPMLIWLLCPLVLYWICRIWLLTRRGEMHHDPVVFTLRDPTGYVVGAIAAVIVILAQ